MPKMKLIVALLAVASMASAMGEEGHDPHMHDRLAKDVDAFHAQFAPLWHAGPGPERTRKVCAKAGELERLAGEIRSGDARPLSSALAALKAKCRSGDSAGIDAALFEAHEAFHRLAEPKPGK